MWGLLLRTSGTDHLNGSPLLLVELSQPGRGVDFHLYRLSAPGIKGAVG
jgi:hypothetical protein